MTMQLVLLVAMFLAKQQQADAIHATEVPTFTWRVRVASCPASESGNVNSKYGLRRVIHSGSAWSAWTDFNATDTKHWLATYPDTSEQSSDNYFPLVTVVVISAPPSCYSSHGLLSYEMQAKIGTSITALNASLDLNAEPYPANVSAFGVMTCNTTRSNGLAGPGATWTPCWPAKVMTTREFNDRMIWHREGSPVPTLPAARSPIHLPIVTTVRSIAHDVGEYLDHFVALRKLGFNQICIFEDGMTGPTKPMYKALVAAGVTRTCFGTHNTPGGGWDSGDNGTTAPASAWRGGPVSLQHWADGLASAWSSGGVPLDQFGVTSVKDEPGWSFPSISDFSNTDPHCLFWFHEFMERNSVKPVDVGCGGGWESSCGLINRTEATSLPLRRRLYWSLRFPSWYEARSWHNATVAMQNAFTPNVTVFVNWNNWAGRFYTPSGSAKSPDAGSGAHDWFEFGRERGTTLLWTEDWFADYFDEHWSLFASRLAGAAALGGPETNFGSYVVPRSSAGWGFQMRVHSLLAHGAKAIKYFAFGPEWSFPGNCWGDDVATFAQHMVNTHTMAADAEPLLWPGIKRKSDVAILYPRSSQVWDQWESAPPGSDRFPKYLVDGGNKYIDGETMDYFCDADFIYLSLTLGWGVDAFWIDEGELTAEGLKRFKTVIITEPHLPATAQTALLIWAQRGGTIVTTMGAASFDEYNTPSSVLIDGLGIQRQTGLPAKPTTLPDGTRLWNNISATALLPNGLNLTAWGGVETVSAHSSSSTVLAKFEDGRPALASAKVGTGNAFHFPWHPGLSVARAENLAFDLDTYGQQNRLSPGIGWLLRNVTLASGARPAVDVSAALGREEYRNGTYVETPVLDSAGGTLVTILNWRNTTGTEFPLAVAVNFRVGSVESALVGKLPFTQDTASGRVSFTLPSLPNTSDFISIARSGQADTDERRALKSDDGPPSPPSWRNDSANVAITASLNKYLALTSFADSLDSKSVIDGRPISLDWSVVGDMPHALKDGIACWLPPTAGLPEGQVLIAGGLWPSGIAHTPSFKEHLNHSLSFNVATKGWTTLPLPPFVPGRTQGACLPDSLVVISGGDGGTVGSRVMRLRRPTSSSMEWAWDIELPPLPANASRFLGAAHAIGDRWLLLGLGAPSISTPTNKAGTLVPYRLDLQSRTPRWEPMPLYPAPAAAARQHITLPISAVVGSKWLVFGGQYGASTAETAAWAELPADIASMVSFGPRPSTTTVDVRDAYAYDPATNMWEALPRLPFGFIAGPKHAPVVAGRYVLLLGAQQRLTARRGHNAAPSSARLSDLVTYYGDDVLVYDSVDRVYASAGKMLYGVGTASWVSNGTHALGFGGEPAHGWNGNTESAIQMSTITLSDEALAGHR